MCYVIDKSSVTIKLEEIEMYIPDGSNVSYDSGEPDIDKLVPVENSDETVIVPDVLIVPVGYENGRIHYQRITT
jgi:hypothetical protein